MNQKHIIILSALIGALISLNSVNFMSRERLKKNYAILVEEGTASISINEAEAIDLESLPGIGPVMANRIVEYRTINGRFNKLEDLKKIKGIGDKLLQKILPFIKL